MDAGFTAGREAQADGKSLTCQLKDSTAETRRLVCILYGGVEPLRDGIVAVLKIRIAPHPPAGPVRLRVEQAIAAFTDLSKVPMDPVETTFKVQTR